MSAAKSGDYLVVRSRISLPPSLFELRRTSRWCGLRPFAQHPAERKTRAAGWHKPRASRRWRGDLKTTSRQPASGWQGETPGEDDHVAGAPDDISVARSCARAQAGARASWSALFGRARPGGGGFVRIGAEPCGLV